MQIRIRVQGDSLEVHARGALTSESAAELLSEVAKELAPRPRDVALDLADVTSISAGALAYVFRIQKQAEGAQRHLTITAVSPAVQRLLDSTHVAHRLDGVTAVATVAQS